MKAFFDLHRFGRLFLKHTTEHYRGYLMSFAVLTGVMVLGGSFLLYVVNFPINLSTQIALFLVILLLAGTIFTSTIFSDLGDRKKAIAVLSLPASHFEKYLVAWIYSFLVFLIVYTISFYLLLLFAVHVRRFPNQVPEVFNVFERRVLATYIVYAFLHSVAFFGAIFFEKLHFIKTAFVFFISLGLLFIINKILLGVFTGRVVDASPPFGNLRFSDNQNIVDINLMTEQKDTYMTYFIMVLALLFWVAAYYRLKEKQI